MLTKYPDDRATERIFSVHVIYSRLIFSPLTVPIYSLLHLPFRELFSRLSMSQRLSSSRRMFLTRESSACRRLLSPLSAAFWALRSSLRRVRSLIIASADFRRFDRSELLAFACGETRTVSMMTLLRNIKGHSARDQMVDPTQSNVVK